MKKDVKCIDITWKIMYNIISPRDKGLITGQAEKGE